MGHRRLPPTEPSSERGGTRRVQGCRSRPRAEGRRIHRSSWPWRSSRRRCCWHGGRRGQALQRGALAVIGPGGPAGGRQRHDREPAEQALGSVNSTAPTAFAVRAASRRRERGLGDGSGRRGAAPRPLPAARRGARRRRHGGRGVRRGRVRVERAGQAGEPASTDRRATTSSWSRLRRTSSRPSRAPARCASPPSRRTRASTSASAPPTSTRRDHRSRSSWSTDRATA